MAVRSVRVAATLYSPTTRPFGVHARSVSQLDFRLECRNMRWSRDEGNQVSHPHKPTPDPSARTHERGPGKDYIIQQDDAAHGLGSWLPPKRQAISLMRVSTLRPASRSWIMCSRLSPACSPAAASLLIAATRDAVCMGCAWPPTDFREDGTGAEVSPEPEATLTLKLCEGYE
jgi:hypothetical protein